MTTKETEEDLPIIKLVKETKVTCYDWELEMDDDTFAMMVKMGKEEATDQDFVNIAMLAGLKHYLDKE
jgi:hypothetical protein